MPIFRPGLPLLRRVAGALLARGNYVPAETRTNARGETVVVSEEVVERNGILGSRTVWMAGFALLTGVANLAGWDFDIPPETADTLYSSGTVFFAALAGLFRVRATMPTVGSPPA